MRTMKPIRYVLNDDMRLPALWVYTQSSNCRASFGKTSFGNCLALCQTLEHVGDGFEIRHQVELQFGKTWNVLFIPGDKNRSP